MIKGAIFDVDGTLLDSMGMWRTFVSDLIKKYRGVPDEDIDERMRYCSLSETAAFLADNYIGCSHSEGEDICMKETMDFYKNRAKLKSGAGELCRSLREKGVEMYIATATYRPLVEAALEREGLLPLFKGIVTCSDVGKGKTEPDVFLHALKDLGCDVSHTWVFEDAYHAVKTAKSIGLRVHCVYDATEADHVAELKELADIYTDDFVGAKVENYN